MEESLDLQFAKPTTQRVTEFPGPPEVEATETRFDAEKQGLPQLNKYLSAGVRRIHKSNLISTDAILHILETQER